MKNLLSVFATLMMVLFAAGCSNNDDMVVASQDAQTTVTRAVSDKTPKLTTYIETNDINPLNMGEYYFCGTNPKDYVVDHVILFASNIRGTASTVELYHNPNQSHILANVNTLVRPLQDKGIKVLLGLLGDHTGVGFANLNNAQIESFAQQVADCVNNYGLDGVDFDDEYAEYAIPAFKALNGRAMFIVAGAPACMDDLKAAGIENFIHVRVNVLDTLKEFNAKLLK